MGGAARGRAVSRQGGGGRPRPAGRYLAPSPRRGVTWGTLRQGGGDAVQPGLLVRVEGVHLFGNSEIYSSHGVPTGNQGRGKTPRRPRNAWPLSWSGRGLADELEALLPSPASSWGLSSCISVLKGTKSSWLSPSAPNPQLGSLLCTQMRLAQPLARSEPFAGRGGPEGLRHPAV